LKNESNRAISMRGYFARLDAIISGCIISITHRGAYRNGLYNAFGQKQSETRFVNVKMRILVSNDDCIYSPGIVSLAKVASHFGDVRIVAPDVGQSSMSHAITSSRPLRFKRIHLDDFDA